MSPDEEKRARIIAAQAAREAAAPPRKPEKRRSNWARSSPVAPVDRSVFRTPKPPAATDGKAAATPTAGETPPPPVTPSR